VRRFRLLFLVVAVALLVPAALLARRALQSVATERDARQQSVAERVFDEMERALSGFLAAEEERPFGHYAREYTPAGEPAGVTARSPLADPPALPFVIGYFQRDPDGTLRLPVERPRPAESDEIARAIDAYWAAPAGAAKLGAGAEIQAPGSTVELDRTAPSEPLQQALRDERENDGPVSAYDALRALNKGIEQRADRQSKVSSEYAKPAAEESASGAKRNERRAGQIGASSDGWRESKDDANEKWERERFELSPMIGRLVGERRLMLFRTVVHERQAYRQGLLLDVDKLGAWLGERALGASELAAHATVSFGTVTRLERAKPGRRIYQHRFAEPFEALDARLALSPLPGLGGAGSIYALAGLSLAVAMLGLGALYRMVAVTVRYAEQRSNFVAAVTHELKTPLTAIRMYGEMLRDGMVPSQAKRDEYHRHITAESERLSRLVDNVLELSRLEKGTRRARLERADAGAVCREVAALVAPHVEGAGLALRLDLEDELPSVRLDRDALKQVLFNLVDNAVKYANGANPKEIVLRCRRAGGGLQLTVRDHGPGVPAHHQRRIFEPFYRGESELTRRSKGTGIGLALVRGLAQEMGARVSGRNRSEGGFEVELDFPAEED
jgi:signal transduction histidine kinase